MNCCKCDFQKATEFTNEIGHIIKHGYCKDCLERAIRNCEFVDWNTRSFPIVSANKKVHQKLDGTGPRKSYARR